MSFISTTFQIIIRIVLTVPHEKIALASTDKERGTDGSKSEFLTHAENDHARLMDKVDYYPKHKVESPGSSGVDMNMKDLPDCPCNPQPCMWPPTCKPQMCTPPCKRHYNVSIVHLKYMF